MSGFNSLHGLSAGAEPKQISSRLLNMKFMQRAAASDKSTPNSAPQTPRSEPPLKRRRTGEYTSLGHDSPSTPTSTINTPSLAERLPTAPVPRAGAATLPEGASISRDQNRYVGEHYETEWILDSNLPVTNGYHDSNDGESESSEEDIWSSNLPSGRQTYGAFKTKKSVAATNTSTLSTPQSMSKSAKRNASNKRSAADADLSSVSGSDSDASAASDAESGEVSDVSESELNTYSSSRAHQASKKHKAFTTTRTSNPKFMSTSAQSVPRLDTGDFLKFDESSANDRAGSGSWNSPNTGRGGQKGGKIGADNHLLLPSRGAFFTEAVNRKNDRQNGKSGGADRFNSKQNGQRGPNNGNKRKKKRKTM